jgi:hypothetical protein
MRADRTDKPASISRRIASGRIGFGAACWAIQSSTNPDNRRDMVDAKDARFRSRFAAATNTELIGLPRIASFDCLDEMAALPRRYHRPAASHIPKAARLKPGAFFRVDRHSVRLARGLRGTRPGQDANQHDRIVAEEEEVEARATPDTLDVPAIAVPAVKLGRAAIGASLKFFHRSSPTTKTQKSNPERAHRQTLQVRPFSAVVANVAPTRSRRAVAG